MTDWQLIETANTEDFVDLWSTGAGGGKRFTDCKFTTPARAYNPKTGKYPLLPPVWCSMEIVGYDSEMGWEPVFNPTHWMPLPPSPSDS